MDEVAHQDAQDIVRESDTLKLNRNFDQEREDREAYLGQIGIKEASDRRIIFRRLPLSVWVAGLLIIISSLYLIYHLALGQYGVLFDGYREGYWWQYFISLIILVFGVVFMHAGKIEMVIIDKSAGILSKSKTSIFC